MYQQQVYYLINVLMLADGMIVIWGGYAAYYVRRWMGDYLWSMDGNVFLGVVLFVMFVNNFVMGRLGLYSDKRHGSFWVLARRITLAVVLDMAFVNIGLYALHIDPLSRLFIALYAGIILASFLIERGVMEYYLEQRSPTNFNSRQIVIVGTGERVRMVYAALTEQKSWGHQVIGQVLPAKGDDPGMDDLPVLGHLDKIESILFTHSVDEIFFVLSGDDSPRVNLKPVLELCDSLGIDCRIVPALYDPNSGLDLKVETIQDIPTLSRSTVRLNATGLLYKRLLDLVVGVVGFLLLIVMYPFVALAIKLDSPGPVFFLQPRVGRNGRIFKLYKFRTMYRDAEQRKAMLVAEQGGDARFFKMDRDPRITRVGRFLRKFSIDEFPQFINVLKGEMSLVGTRPPTPEEVEMYDLQHRKRIAIKPGITGLWQISGRSQITDFDEVVKLDLKYIDGWRFVTDLKILWKTIFVVLQRKGAF